MTALEMNQFMSHSAVRESLFAELKHADTLGPAEIKLLRLEAFLKPMYAALSKNFSGMQFEYIVAANPLKMY